MIPSAYPFLGQEEIDAVTEVLTSGWLGTGPKTQQFEKALVDMIGCKHAIAVNSGTAALHLALAGFSIGHGDEVIVPSMTFCASVQAIVATGATPIFAEVEPATLCLSLTDVRRRISQKSRAIMPVHYGGQTCDLDELMKIADEFSLTIIEDAAHAFGSTFRGQQVGTIGHATCFSFDPIKTITCGEGGAITLQDDLVAKRIRSMRMLGMSLDGYQRYKRKGGSYEVLDEGYRYHMSDINAAIGLQQLKKFSTISVRRREIWRRYCDAFTDVNEIFVLDHDMQQVVPFHFVVRVLGGLRDALTAYLRDREIGVGIHYPPNHLQPFFYQESVRLPVTEEIFEQIMTLPLYPSMPDETIEFIIQTVKVGLKVVKEKPNVYHI